jgi:hypothetical protein
MIIPSYIYLTNENMIYWTKIKLAWCDLVYLLTITSLSTLLAESVIVLETDGFVKTLLLMDSFYMTSCVLNVLHFNNTLMNVLTANKPYFVQIDAVSYTWPIRYPVSHVNNIYVVFSQICFVIGKVIFFMVQLFYINYVAYIFV